MSWALAVGAELCPGFAIAHDAHEFSTVRWGHIDNDQDRVDRLNEDLLHGDQDKFWCSYKYYNYSKGSQAARINGLSDVNAIANCFAHGFSDV